MPLSTSDPVDELIKTLDEFFFNNIPEEKQNAVLQVSVPGPYLIRLTGHTYKQLESNTELFDKLTKHLSPKYGNIQFGMRGNIIAVSKL